MQQALRGESDLVDEVRSTTCFPKGRHRRSTGAANHRPAYPEQQVSSADLKLHREVALALINWPTDREAGWGTNKHLQVRHRYQGPLKRAVMIQFQTANAASSSLHRSADSFKHRRLLDHTRCRICHPTWHLPIQEIAAKVKGCQRFAA